MTFLDMSVLKPKDRVVIIEHGLCYNGRFGRIISMAWEKKYGVWLVSLAKEETVFQQNKLSLVSRKAV